MIGKRQNYLVIILLFLFKVASSVITNNLGTSSRAYRERYVEGDAILGASDCLKDYIYQFIFLAYHKNLALDKKRGGKEMPEDKITLGIHQNLQHLKFQLFSGYLP